MGRGDPQGGRPYVDIDLDMLAKLCAIQCTRDECAAVMGISKNTITRRLAEMPDPDESEAGDTFDKFFSRHCHEGRASLRRAQFTAAMGNPAKAATLTEPAVKLRAPNITMQIWLGKQWLGQEDKITHEIDVLDGTRPMFEVIVPIMGKGKGNGRDITEGRPDPDQAAGAD